jgi:hypothetical protein
VHPDNHVVPGRVAEQLPDRPGRPSLGMAFGRSRGFEPPPTTGLSQFARDTLAAMVSEPEEILVLTTEPADSAKDLAPVGVVRASGAPLVGDYTEGNFDALMARLKANAAELGADVIYGTRLLHEPAGPGRGSLAYGTAYRFKDRSG